jgi:hypothetical protein
MQLIWPELVQRFNTPRTSLTFYAHLCFGVVICGGLGVFLTFLKSGWAIEDVSAALLGYFPAVVGSAVLEFTGDYQPYIRSLGVLALAVLLMILFVVLQTTHVWQLIFCVLGAAISILLWWIANGLNERFNDVRPESALGGNTLGSLSESEDKSWKK